jgi:hypothetical protein
LVILVNFSLPRFNADVVNKVLIYDPCPRLEPTTRNRQFLSGLSARLLEQRQAVFAEQAADEFNSQGAARPFETLSSV